MVIIRLERPEDREAIFHVHASAFPTDAEAQLVDALRTTDRLTISLVADEDGTVVGHVALSPVRVDDQAQGLGLAPLAVLPPSRGQGIGGRLVRQALLVATAALAPFVVVLGDPVYYGRFGFRAASMAGLEGEFGGGDAFQVIELAPGGLPAEGGLVRYALEFQLVA